VSADAKTRRAGSANIVLLLDVVSGARVLPPVLKRVKQRVVKPGAGRKPAPRSADGDAA
jgi:hypothetical protein